MIKIFAFIFGFLWLQAATMKLNFTGVEPFGPLPEGGVYGAEVMVSEMKTSKQGNPSWHRVFKIIDAPEGSGEVHRADGVTLTSDVEYLSAINRQIFDDQGLTEKSRWAVMADLQAFGESVDPNVEDFEFDPAEYIGRRIGLVVANNLYQGNTRAQLAKLVPSEYIGFSLDDPRMSETAEAVVA